MKRILPILAAVVFCVLARGAAVILQWEPPENKTNLTGYVVKLATNNGPWLADIKRDINAIRLEDIAPGRWKVGIAAVRGTNIPVNPDWSLVFSIDPTPITNVPPVGPITFTGLVAASVLVNPNGTNIIFWIRPSQLTAP